MRIENKKLPTANMDLQTAILNLTVEIKKLREDLRPELKKTEMMHQTKLVQKNFLEILKTHRIQVLCFQLHLHLFLNHHQSHHDH